MLAYRLIDFNILNQKDTNMPHIYGQSPDMEKYSKWHHIHMITNLVTINPPKEYSLLWYPCYIMPGQSIQRCFEQLMKYCDSNKIQHGTPRKTHEYHYTIL